MKLVTAYIAGLVFGVGISISGMANPAKVINFFDIAGTWDPSLAFVMGGALIVALIGYRLVFKTDRPLLEPAFILPVKTDLDTRLIGGSAIFGIGWGLAGFCPGGALPVLVSGGWLVVLFVAAVVAGMAIVRFIERGLMTRTLRETTS